MLERKWYFTKSWNCVRLSPVTLILKLTTQTTQGLQNVCKICWSWAHTNLLAGLYGEERFYRATDAGLSSEWSSEVVGPTNRHHTSQPAGEIAEQCQDGHQENAREKEGHRHRESISAHGVKEKKCPSWNSYIKRKTDVSSFTCQLSTWALGGESLYRVQSVWVDLGLGLIMLVSSGLSDTGSSILG